MIYSIVLYVILYSIDQPPLKRKLLTKFDRTVDCIRRSKLTPAKSSSDGKTVDLF